MGAPNNNNTPDTTNDIDYIAVIEEMKNNTVNKDEYDKLKQDHARLLQSIINGESSLENNGSESQATPEPETPEAINQKIATLRKELFNSNDDSMTNLDYITKAMELREMIIKKGEPDPFLPAGMNISPTEEDIKCAEKVADVFQQCIDYAKGDPTVFTNELQRRTLNSMPNRR